MQCPQKTPFSVTCIKCVLSNKTSPLLGSFFNPKSFNFFTDIYPAPRYLILWKTKGQKDARLSLQSHRDSLTASVGGAVRKGHVRRHFLVAPVAPFTTENIYSMKLWKADGTPQNVLENKKKTPKKKKPRWRKKGQTSSRLWLITLCLVSRSCLKGFLSAMLILCLCLKAPSLSSPCLHFPPFIFFLLSSLPS